MVLPTVVVTALVLTTTVVLTMVEIVVDVNYLTLTEVRTHAAVAGSRLIFTMLVKRVGRVSTIERVDANAIIGFSIKVVVEPVTSQTVGVVPADAEITAILTVEIVVPVKAIGSFLNPQTDCTKRNLLVICFHFCQFTKSFRYSNWLFSYFSCQIRFVISFKMVAKRVVNL